MTNETSAPIQIPQQEKAKEVIQLLAGLSYTDAYVTLQFAIGLLSSHCHVQSHLDKTSTLQT